MSATIKLYELAGARCVSSFPLLATDDPIVTWRDLDAFGGKPAKQWDTLVELDFEQIVQSPNLS